MKESIFSGKKVVDLVIFTFSGWILAAWPLRRVAEGTEMNAEKLKDSGTQKNR